MHALKVGPQNLRTLKDIAASLRRRAEQTIPAFSTMQIIEACFPGTLVTGRVLERGVDELVRVDKRAFRTHRAPHTIVYNRKRSTAEQRYAIAHALGHIIFDGSRSRGCQDNVARELRCDRFADELLVPLEELAPFVCAWPSADRVQNEVYLDMADQIASQFHVPAEVIHRRIKELPRPR
jgi:hypothetical protein